METVNNIKLIPSYDELEKHWNSGGSIIVETSYGKKVNVNRAKLENCLVSDELISFHDCVYFGYSTAKSIQLFRTRNNKETKKVQLLTDKQYYSKENQNRDNAIIGFK